MYAIKCKHSAAVEILQLTNFITFFVYTMLNNISVSSQCGLLKPTASTNLAVLIWTRSNLTSVLQKNCMTISTLKLLDFSENTIKNLPCQCFKHFEILAVLLVAGNKIATLPVCVFDNVKNLRKLDLSRNCLTHLPSTAIPSLLVLNVSSNYFEHFSTHIADKQNVKYVATDDFRLCCLLKESPTTCTADPTWPLSCNVLLDNLATEVSSATIFILIALLNTFVLIKEICRKVCACRNRNTVPGNINLAKKEDVSAFTVCLIWQNINDMLFSVCGVIVFSKSFYFGKTFPAFILSWLGSIECKFLTFLFGFTVNNTIYVANYLAITRLFAVKFPFKSTFKDTNSVLRHLNCGSVGISIFCILCQIIYSTAEHQSLMSSVLCSFLGKTKGSPTNIVFTLTVAAAQIIIFPLILILYILICNELRKSSQVTCSKDRSTQQTSVTIQAVVILLSCALCWLPSAAIFITSVIMTTYPIQMMLWNVMFVLPLASFMNPIIYGLFPSIKHCLEKN